MSTTLKALNRLEQQLVDRPATGVSKIPNGRDSHQATLLLKSCQDRRLVVLIAACSVFLLFETVLGSALKPRLETNGGAFGDQSVPSPTRYPIPRPSVTSEANPSTSSGLQPFKNDIDYAGSIGGPQDTISQWYGDGLKLQAIVWSMNPAARKAFINSRFVRPGQTVDDYMIAAISEKSVVVSDGQQLWRVILGR